MYQADQKPLNKRRRRFKRLIIALLILAVLAGIVVYILHHLKPNTTIHQAAAITTNISSSNDKKLHYVEPDFSIDIPATWQPQPRPPHTYESFTWQVSEKGTNGQTITIFEDTIPANFAVNRELAVQGEVDHIVPEGDASDNCSTYTKGTAITNGEFGVPAKWQGVSFLCDQSNTERDVIGTSSTDGVNTVILKTSQGVSHKFFFSYENQNFATPDYSAFYDALRSFKMN